MVVRLAVASLWFFAIWFAFGLVAYFITAPAAIGAALGAIAAVWVFADPAGIVWKSRSATDPQVGTVNRLEPTRATN